MGQFLKIVELKTEISSGFYVTDCDPEKWPSVYFLVSNYWFEVSPEHYLVDASEEKDDSKCLIAFTANDSDYFLIGDAFFRGFYSVHDDNNDRIGFAPHSESNKTAAVFASTPPKNSIKLGFFVKYKQEILIVAGSILVVAGLAIFATILWPKFWKWYKGKGAA